MNYDGGQCVGCDDALEWVRDLKGVDEDMRDKVFRRMAYEFDKGVPTRPKFHKGLYGKQYDSYTCGHCGFVLSISTDKFCANCGSMIMKPDPNGRAADGGFHHYQVIERQRYEQLTFDFVEGAT